MTLLKIWRTWKHEAIERLKVYSPKSWIQTLKDFDPEDWMHFEDLQPLNTQSPSGSELLETRTPWKPKALEDLQTLKLWKFENLEDLEYRQIG